MSKNEAHNVRDHEREKAITVAIVRKGTDPEIVSEHLDELELLLDTAGADVVFSVYQERDRPEVGTAVGKGKLEEIAALVEEQQVHMVVFDDELSPIQIKNIEEATKVKVLDRTGVILDIFAAHARTAEARTQVELAQTEYLMPRLTRMWTHLSKQFGGIGTKGPGETQIETDRRILRRKMQRLREKLKEIDVQRTIQRKGRDQHPRFALVGYTNAGKSSIMRVITASEMYVQDQLFATLDTTVRSFDLATGQRALLSDTVGFIRKLPAQLVASFRTTLAETLEADVLLHVVDVSHRHFRDQLNVVEQTLAELGAEDKPIIVVFNKIDLIEDRWLLEDIEAEYPGCVFVSAARELNIKVLLERMQQTVEELSVIRTLLVPYSDSRVVSQVYERSEVMDRRDGDHGTTLVVKVPTDKLSTFQREYAPYIDNEPA
jgi:GTPase